MMDTFAFIMIDTFALDIQIIRQAMYMFSIYKTH